MHNKLLALCRDAQGPLTYIKRYLLLKMVVICGSCSNSINSRRPGIFCCTCKKQFHSNCVSNADDLPDLLNSIGGLSWKCDDCVNSFISVNQYDVETIIKEQVQNAISNLKETFDSLTSNFLKSVESKLQPVLAKQQPGSSSTFSGTKKLNYAQIARNKAQPGVIIKPKDNKQECSKTKSDVVKEICPADSNIQLSKLRTVKEGGLLLGCKDINDNRKLKEMVQQRMSNSYDVMEVRGVNPRIRIVGISRKLEEQKLLDTIRKCNRDIFSDNSTCSLVKFWPTKKDKNIFQATLQVDRFTFESAFEFGNLFVDLDCCKVFDAIEVFRCFNCNEFHHNSSNCKNSISCPRCGQNHKVQECKAGSLTCSNCVRLNEKLSGSVDTGHATWDLSLCTAYIQACNRLRSDVLADQ